MIKLVEVYDRQGEYGMREIMINPQHVIAMREDSAAKTALMENRMPSGLSKSLEFTRIYLNSGQFNLNVVVAESLASVEMKLNGSKKLLKG